MGGLSLTNPGLVYQDQQIDPTTGQPIVRPRVAFFPNNAARAQAFAEQESKDINPSTSTVDGSIDGQPTVGTITPPMASAPKFFKPSFTSTLTDPSTGLPAPVNPAQTKLGKLVSILGAAAKGGLAGWGYGNAAQGAQAAREIPFEQAQQRQELEKGQAQTALLREQANMVPTPYGPMPLGMARYMFPSMIRGQATLGAAKIGAESRENVADTNATSRADVAQIAHRFHPTPTGLWDAASGSYIPNSAKGTLITPEIAGDFGLPSGYLGQYMNLGEFSRMRGQQLQALPETSTQTTSINPVTGATTQSTTRQKQGASGIVGGGPAVPSFIQRTAGGPLAQAAPSGAGTTAAPRSAGGAAALRLPAAYQDRVNALAPEDQAVFRQVDPITLTSLFKLADGEIAPQTWSSRGGYRGATMPLATAEGLASRINPAYRGDLFAVRQQLDRDYVSTNKEGGEIRAFSTFLNHAGDAADVVDNWRDSRTIGTGVPLLNRPLNWLRDNVGGSEQFKRFEAALAPVRKEYYSFLNSKRAEHESDLNDAHIVLSDNSTPAQIEGVLKQWANTAILRLDGINDQYYGQTGINYPKLITPQAKTAATKLGYGDAVAKYPTQGTASGVRVREPEAGQQPSGKGTQQNKGGIRFTPIS